MCWVDGEIVPLSTPVVRGDDSAFSLGLGCYTSALIRDGDVRHLDRHVRRLTRGAAELGLGQLAPETVERAFRDLARAALPRGCGVVRLQASRDGDGRLRLVGVPRGLGRDSATWRAILAPLPHDGAELSGGLKVTSRLTLALAAERAREVGADEALLLDAGGRLVEGARSNVFAVDASGALRTPPLARGAVAGIARELVLERVPGAVEGDVQRDALYAARELIAVNAVRGARPILWLDDRSIGSGQPGPWAQRLAEALSAD